MGTVTINAVVRNYDFIAPIVCGDVATPGFDLNITRTPDALAKTRANSEFEVGEHSFSRYLIESASGHRDFVGLPVIVTRGFRHRCFFVSRDGSPKSVGDLAGKRVGTNEWPATGNTWARAVIREAGVQIDQIDWVVGQVDATSKPLGNDHLPSFARYEREQFLIDMLVDGELDVIMCPLPPDEFGHEDSRIVRMYPNFRADEQTYFQRTGVFPGHHILVMRRSVFEANPTSALLVYQAFEASRRMWEAARFRYTETTPWLLAELEDARKIIGPEFQPYGVGPNATMIQALCEELYQQGLVQQPIDPSLAFKDYTTLAES